MSWACTTWPVCVVNPEYLRDDGAGNSSRIALHDFDLAIAGRELEALLEPLRSIVAHEGLDLGGVVIAESGVEERADLSMTGLGDRGHHRILFGCLAGIAKAPNERLDALEPVLDGPLAHHEALTARGLMDRGLRAHLSERRVAGLRLRVEGIDPGLLHAVDSSSLRTPRLDGGHEVCSDRA